MTTFTVLALDRKLEQLSASLRVRFHFPTRLPEGVETWRMQECAALRAAAGRKWTNLGGWASYLIVPRLSLVTGFAFRIQNLTWTHWWFSGRILACHAGGPGSIPGQCIRTFLFFFFFFFIFAFFLFPSTRRSQLRKSRCFSMVWFSCCWHIFSMRTFSLSASFFRLC